MIPRSPQPKDCELSLCLIQAIPFCHICALLPVGLQCTGVAAPELGCSMQRPTAHITSHMLQCNNCFHQPGLAFCGPGPSENITAAFCLTLTQLAFFTLLQLAVFTGLQLAVLTLRVLGLLPRLPSQQQYPHVNQALCSVWRQSIHSPFHTNGVVPGISTIHQHSQHLACPFLPVCGAGTLKAWPLVFCRDTCW